MSIETRQIREVDYANMIETDCFSCRSYGKILYKSFHGYEGSDEISDKEKQEAEIAARTHLEQKENHTIVIYEFHNIPKGGGI